jgi:hypothetical protein
MNMHVFLLACLLIVSLARLGALYWSQPDPVRSRAAAKVRSTLPRLLKPRTPNDCPACRLASSASTAGEPAPVPVRPWCEVKSRRGAPKRIDTEGFACPNRQCSYFGKTDARVHALVDDGKHGKAEHIQRFRCQVCHTTFSARRDTPLYRLKTPSRAGSRWCSLRWLKGWTHPRLNASSAFDKRPSRGGSHTPPSTLRRCTSGPSSICTSHTSSWTNCVRGYADRHRCSGYGWRLILARRFCRCLSWVPAPNTWPIVSSIPCESAWLLAASRSLPAMGSICTFMLSQPILDTGKR